MVLELFRYQIIPPGSLCNTSRKDMERKEQENRESSLWCQAKGLNFTWKVKDLFRLIISTLFRFILSTLFRFIICVLFRCRFIISKFTGR